MPQVQRLIEYMEQSLAELEQATGLVPAMPMVDRKPIKTTKKVAKKSTKKIAKKVTKKVAKKTSKKTAKKVAKS
jgi:hypothetical protein